MYICMYAADLEQKYPENEMEILPPPAFISVRPRAGEREILANCDICRGRERCDWSRQAGGGGPSTLLWSPSNGLNKARRGNVFRSSRVVVGWGVERFFMRMKSRGVWCFYRNVGFLRCTIKVWYVFSDLFYRSARPAVYVHWLEILCKVVKSSLNSLECIFNSFLHTIFSYIFQLSSKKSNMQLWTSNRALWMYICTYHE